MFMYVHPCATIVHSVVICLFAGFDLEAYHLSDVAAATIYPCWRLRSHRRLVRNLLPVSRLERISGVHSALTMKMVCTHV
jgi:hypothetical protein